MSSPIVFYDLTRNVPSGQSPKALGWSPNTWKTRLALGIKGVPFKTEWLRWVEIAPKSKEYGLTGKATGIPFILPVIVDPATNRVVRDSFEIAKYLDEQYPDKNRLLPPHTTALQVAFADQVAQNMVFAIFPILILDIHAQCDEKDAAYFRESREKMFGTKIENVQATGEVRAAKIKEFTTLLDNAARWISQNGENAVFINGDTPTHADTALAGVFLWIQKVAGKDHEVSKIIETANEGRWAKYLEAFSKYIIED